MPIESEIYDRLVDQLAASVDAVYDTIRPDGLVLGALPIVVFQRIVSTPISTLSGTLAFQQPNFQISVYCSPAALTAGRGVRAATIAALHNFRAGSIKGSWLVSDLEIPPTPEIPEFHIPIDFIFAV